MQKKKNYLYAAPEESLKLLMALDDEHIEAHQVRTLIGKALLGGSKLEHLGNIAQIAALIRRQHLSRRHADDIERIGRNNSRIDITVINQVANHFEHILLGRVRKLCAERPGQNFSHVQHSVRNVGDGRRDVFEEKERGALEELDGTLEPLLHFRMLHGLLTGHFVRHLARSAAHRLHLVDPQFINLDRRQVDEDVLLQDALHDGTEHFAQLVDPVTLPAQLDDQFDDQSVAGARVVQGVHLVADLLLQGALEQL